MNTVSKGCLLLIEDEPTVQSNNAKILKRRGYKVKQAYSIKEAWKFVNEEQLDGIILDIQLPDGNGFEFLVELRKTSNIPVLVLTSLETSEDIIRGFELGSDDYLTKPYDLSVFLVRIETLLRRSSTVPDTAEYGDFRLYPLAGRAMLSGVDLGLSQKEYSILQLLLQNPEKLLSTEFLYEKVWGMKMIENDNSLKVAISKLRTKLADSDYTVTASRGEGYYIERLEG
jgi:DNA-binding response OmpR family regulator